MQFHSKTANNLVSTDPIPGEHETLIYLGTPSHTTSDYPTLPIGIRLSWTDIAQDPIGPYI